jgi:hypothetical protein
LFQIMYMIPRRRAFAYLLPAASAANSQAITASARALPEATRTEVIQSTARPS